VTTQAIYNWIKRGELKVTRVDGRYVATRKAVRDTECFIEGQWAKWSRPKDRPLTDDEFLQALWDSDPD
jgi:hypothetical protein